MSYRSLLVLGIGFALSITAPAFSQAGASSSRRFNSEIPTAQVDYVQKRAVCRCEVWSDRRNNLGSVLCVGGSA